MSLKEFGADKFEIVFPSFSILAEPPVAVVDKVEQTRHAGVAKAYLEYLYIREGRKYRANFFRPRDQTVAGKYAYSSQA